MLFPGSMGNLSRMIGNIFRKSKQKPYQIIVSRTKHAIQGVPKKKYPF